MSQQTHAVGDATAQQRFVATHEPLIREFPEIHALLNVMFTRALQEYNDEGTSDVTGLEPSEADETEERLAQIVVLDLERVAFDDFVELLTLAGNEMGFGAYKILRSLYER